MATDYNFRKIYKCIYASLVERKEQQLLEANRAAHRDKKEPLASHKVIETFVAPPHFLLYVWATIPLLFIATFEKSAIIAGIVASTINLFIIHFDTFPFIRFLLTGLVLLLVIVLFRFSLI